MSTDQLEQFRYVIVPCDNLDRMKAFYRDTFAFPVDLDTATTLTFRTGSVILALRKRTRNYDGAGTRDALPGIQLAFLVSPAEVDRQHRRLVERGVKIFDPPKDQDWGHRTVYFSDPEGNILEFYAEINT
jgi:catechol 2,3-dioxygenase-like lactoylglutathione lyase family enzyme